jgi:hypothetical protein
MASFFPRHTVAWKLEEPTALRRLMLSVVEMAVLTGIVVRLLRSLALSNAPGTNLLVLAGMFGVALTVLCGMLTLHLGNYPVHQWTWRAPAFAGIEAATEMAVSLGLIALGREPLGSGRAAFGDWPGMLVDTLIVRFVTVVVFAILLAGVVQVVRWALLKHERRDHTAVAIHDDHQRRQGVVTPPEG